MKKTLFGAILTLSFIFSAGIAAKINPQTISGSVGTVKRGGTTRATVVMDIPGNLHVNSNSPGSEYAIPTVVKASATGAKISGIVYPRGKNRKLSFSEDTINVYEGRAIFTFNVTVPANFKGNSVSVRVTTRYQACTDEVCYPPKNKEVILRAKVR